MKTAKILTTPRQSQKTNEEPTEGASKVQIKERTKIEKINDEYMIKDDTQLILLGITQLNRDTEQIKADLDELHDKVNEIAFINTEQSMFDPDKGPELSNELQLPTDSDDEETLSDLPSEEKHDVTL